MNLREFEKQFDTLYLPLGMYALRMVDDIDISEDIAQEAFIKAWEQLKDGGEINNFKAWLYRCVRNACVDYLRRRKTIVTIDEYDDVDENDIDTSELDARIWQAVDELPERCREIFLMSKRDGLSNEEIASELNLSIKTVKNQLTKALSRLRESLSTNHRPFFLPFL